MVLAALINYAKAILLLCSMCKIIQSVSAKPLNTIKESGRGNNLGKLGSRFPFMYSDNPERIEFVTAYSAAHTSDNIIDMFGCIVNLEDMGEGNCKFSLTASPFAMHCRLQQYGRYVKLLSPQSLAVDKREN